MNYLTEHGSCLSKELKAFGNYRKGGNTGFETVITRLQMQTYITVQTFENQIDKNGNEYGWGIARYVVSEDWLGKNNCRGAYRERPEDSFERILEHMVELETQTNAYLGGDTSLSCAPETARKIDETVVAVVKAQHGKVGRLGRQRSEPAGLD